MSIHLAIFGKPRYLGLLEVEAPFPPKGTWLVVETMRGSEIALLGGPLSVDQEARYRASCSDDVSDGQVKGGEPSLQEISLARVATEDDLDAAAHQREEECDVLVKARGLLRNHNLSMKLVDVEFLLDKKKLFFYFTSEQRVDFRAYVRDLAKEFKTRIELRQIGVRDEAKTVKGIAPCGRECCCSHWLHKFTPICIKMVKEQNLALNPTKISGICGRLMCCMSYEYSSYNMLWKNLPNPGSKIRTGSGNYVVEGVELSSDAVRIRRPEGGSVLVSVADFSRFRDVIMEGGQWEDSSSSKLREISFTGKSSAETASFKSGRSLSESPHRASGKRTGEAEGKGKASEQALERKKSPREDVGGEREKLEKKKISPETIRESPPSKGAKKKRRRKKPSPASGDAKNTAAPRTERQQETSPPSEQVSGDHVPKKRTSSEKTSERETAAKTQHEPAPSSKDGETQPKRSSSSRRRRSGRGGKSAKREDQNPQDSLQKNAHNGDTRSSDGTQQRRQKNRPQHKPKNKGEQNNDQA